MTASTRAVYYQASYLTHQYNHINLLLTMLSAISITKKFNETVAVDDLSIEISKGEVVGFLGPNGAGKSTTMRIMTGFLEPDEGRVLINEIPISENKLAASKFIGYLPENNPLYPEMLVCDLINFACELYEIPKKNRRNAIDEVVMATGVEPVFFRPVYQLSKGFKQRVGLCQAIIHKPDILILDEPTEGLDPNQRIEIRRLIKEIGKNKTIILSSHVMQEIEATCGRVIIINKGKLVRDTSIKEIEGLSDRKDRSVLNVELKGKAIVTNIKKLNVRILTSEKGAGGSIILKLDPGKEQDLRQRVVEMARENNWALLEMYSEKTSLEDVFKSLTSANEGNPIE